MATKRYRKSNKFKEFTYEDIKGLDFNSLSPEELEQYGFGSWLKNNASTIGKITTIAGTALTATGVGAGLGAGLMAAGAATTAYGNKVDAEKAKDAQNAQTAKMQTAQNNNIALQELQQDMQVNQPLYGEVMCNGGKIKKMAKGGPVKENYPEFTKDFQYVQPKKFLSQTRFEYGGTLNYGGQLHEGPNGGVPVDAMGNPNQVNPVALVEKGEVSYNTPDGGTYIYSDTLKHDKNKTFAKKAKDVQRRYKFRMKDGVINDPFAKKTYDAEMLQLQDNQEELKNFQNMQKESSEIKKNGGNLPLYFGPNSTNNWSMKLPPLVKPIADTAAMDEFGKQVEIDYRNSLLSLEPTDNSAAKANNSNRQLYQGMNWPETGLAAAGPVLGGITGLILNNKRKAPVNLKLSRMTPQQINLERRRAAARESAGVATSNLTRSLRNAAPTAGSYMSNVIAGITDIDRNLSNALGESYTQEEIQNAQLRQQADAANLDISMQENMYNNQADYMGAAQRNALRNAYLSQIGQGVTSALNQKFQSSRDADLLNMQNPDYAMVVTGKGLRRRKMILPRTQIGG